MGVPLPRVIDFASTLSRLETVGRAFSGAGYELHLVGGMVRDLLLGLPATGDFDLTTDARPEQTRALLAPMASAIWDQGARFGTIGARVGASDFEVTTYRSESYATNSRKPEVAFGDDLMVDLSRRDFTINAMAVSVTTGVLEDPFGGHDDLVARRLRTPLAPALSFIDDPLRMLRAARFIPRFHLEVDPALNQAATEHAHRLEIVSAERIRSELERLLVVDSPRAGMDFLARHGLAQLVVPDLAPLAWNEATARLEMTHDIEVRRGILFSSLGPVEAGARMDALRYSRIDSAATTRLLTAASAAEHLLAQPQQPSDETLRRFVASAGPGAEAEVIDRAVLLATILSERRSPTMLELALAGLREREDLSDFHGPLSGGEVMRILSLPPGRQVGQALTYLRELRMTQGPLSFQDAQRALSELRLDD